MYRVTVEFDEKNSAVEENSVLKGLLSHYTMYLLMCELVEEGGSPCTHLTGSSANVVGRMQIKRVQPGGE